MENRALVSIIVAVYNGEKYLDECINSIVNQTYKNLEIIIVDDGSTDSSGKICDEWSKIDKRIKVIHQQNQGVSQTRNNALNIINGEYFCIIDQDDIIDSEYVAYFYSLIKNNSTEIAAIPKVVLYTANKKIYLEKKDANKVEVWSGEKTACSMLYTKIDIGPWNKMISTSLIKKNKIMFHPELFGGEGYAFSVECFSKASKVAIGYKGMYYYRVDNNTSEMSRYRSRTFYSSLKAIEIMKNYFCNNKKIYRAVKYAEWNVYVAYLQALIASKSEKENKEDYFILKKKCRLLAYRSIYASIPLKRKIKDLMYILFPIKVAKFCLRKKTVREYNDN